MSVEPAYSFSRISTFEQCARRFRYRYLDQVKEAFDSVEGFMGRQVHESIEWLFGERMRGFVPSVSQTISRYCEQWDAQVACAPRAIRVVRRDQDVAGYRKTGAELVARFHREKFASDALETIANEMEFDVEVGARYRFRGYIDRVARDADGRIHVIDYKTGRRVPQRFEGKEADQLHAYALAIFHETDQQEIDLVLEFLRAGTTLRERVKREEMAAIDAQLAARIAVCEDATVFPPTPGALCDWCGYNDICDGYRPRAPRTPARAYA